MTTILVTAACIAVALLVNNGCVQANSASESAKTISDLVKTNDGILASERNIILPTLQHLCSVAVGQTGKHGSMLQSAETIGLQYMLDLELNQKQKSELLDKKFEVERKLYDQAPSEDVKVLQGFMLQEEKLVTNATIAVSLLTGMFKLSKADFEKAQIQVGRLLKELKINLDDQATQLKAQESKIKSITKLL